MVYPLLNPCPDCLSWEKTGLVMVAVQGAPCVLCLILVSLCLRAHDCHVMFISLRLFLLPHEIGILLALSVLRPRRSTIQLKSKYFTALLAGISTSRLACMTMRRSYSDCVNTTTRLFVHDSFCLSMSHIAVTADIVAYL